MMKAKRETLKSRRENALYNNGFIWKGNGKLLDFTADDGTPYRYAQYNTRAIIDCPFRTAGCERICYATKGNHLYTDVKASRVRSYEESRRADFSESVVYSIRTEKDSKRYNNAVMLVRIHESGDFYSVQYLRKWLRAWVCFTPADGVRFVFYTKSFRFFLKLTAEEKKALNALLNAGVVAMNLSMDDTVTPEQRTAYLEMLVNFPKANTYYCTEDITTVKHDNECECADCAKCAKCNRATGETTVVKIHSASKEDMKAYRSKITK